MLPKRDIIAGQLRQRIEDGTYQPGDRLPTEAELMLEHSAARGTIRDALGLLEEEGLVERRVGVAGGTFVRQRLAIDIYAWRDDQPMSTNSESDLFFRTVREQGRTPSQDFSTRNDLMPPAYAELLHVEPGEPATVRRCVRYIDGIPHSIQDSWYPMWLCRKVPLLRSEENIVQGTTRLLADEGYLQRAAYGYSIAMRLSPEDASVLRTTSGQPVLASVLVGYTVDGPLRISAAVFAPGTRLVSAHGDVTLIERHRR